MEKPDLINNAGQAGALTQEEAAAIQAKLWRLLQRRTVLYTMGESSSVRVETAQELLASISFLLRGYLAQKHLPMQSLLNADEEAVFAEALQLAQAKVEQGKELLRRVQQGLPAVQNRSLADTLCAINAFFPQYDVRFFAHRIPADIDYQLSCAVPQSLHGINYIIAYLQRLLIENTIVCCYNAKEVNAVLAAYCPSPYEQLINLYEPVLTNALGQILLGKSGTELRLTQQEQAALAALLDAMPPREMQAALRTAAKRLYSMLELHAEKAQGYMEHTAQSLYPRICAALARQSVEGIFLSW